MKVQDRGSHQLRWQGGVGRVERVSQKGHFTWAIQSKQSKRTKQSKQREVPEKAGLGRMTRSEGWPGFKVFTGKEGEPGKVSWGMFSKASNALLNGLLVYLILFLCFFEKMRLCLHTVR